MEASEPDDPYSSDDGVRSRSAEVTSTGDDASQTSAQGSNGGGADPSKPGHLANKRERSSSVRDTNPKRRRLDHMPPLEYLDLLNGEIRDAQADKHGLYLDPQNRGDIQYGAVPWTGLDRQAFFDKLGRGAELNLVPPQGLRAPKSTFEHHDYESRLKQGLIERELTAKRNLLFRPSEIPAATDISSECEVALEGCADRVAKQLFDAEREREVERHGKYALLDSQSAAELAARLCHDDASSPRDQPTPAPGSEDSSPNEALLHAANVLDLNAMLCLSDTLYMRSEAFEHVDNKGSGSLIADTDVSIFATAFTDLYAVVQAVTKRIVAASIFQANTRLRATDYGETKPRRLSVKVQDVLSAIDLLALPGNSRRYWQGLARRLNLKVVTRPHSTGTRHRRWLSFDEVEVELGVQHAPQTEVGEEHQPERDITDHDDESSASHPLSDEGEPPVEETSDELDHYLDALDKRGSAEEEQQIWGVLKGTAPPSVMDAARAELPVEPSSARRSVVDLKSWKDHCSSRSAWETYGTHIREVSRSFPERHATPQAAGRSKRLPTDVPSGVERSVSPSDTVSDTFTDAANEDAVDFEVADSPSRGRTLRKRNPISYTVEGREQDPSTYVHSPVTDDW